MALTRLGLNQSINLASNTTGTLAVGNGGTGLTSGTTDQILKFTGSTTIASAAQAAGGKLLQVVSGTLTNSTDSTTSTSFVEFDCQVNITPSATSSKILVIMSGGQAYTGTDNKAMNVTIYRDSTNLGNATYGMGRFHVSDEKLSTPHSFHFLDSPNSTASLKYEGFYKSDDGTAVYAGTGSMGTMSITCMEIGA